MLDKIVSEELNVLDGTMTYAEDQIGYVANIGNMNSGCEDGIIGIRSGQIAAYREYLIHAYGKSIRIRTELEGEKLLRLSQSAAIFTGENYNVATPNSPVGRLISIARVGQEDKSKVWGEYEVLDVCQFERYRGTEVVSQRRNFAKMTSIGTLQFVLVNLKQWLIDKLTVSEEPMQQQRPEQLEELLESEEQESAEILRVILGALPEDALQEPVVPTPQPKHYDPQSISLSTWFYVNLSEKQYDAAHARPKGLVVVEGIAGSGKTSVALGRTKALMQLSQLSRDDEHYIEDFVPEAQIGFVRTGELIQYLKDTCQQLELHHFPIKEYSDMQRELRHYWGLIGHDQQELDYLPDGETKIEWADLISNHFAKLAKRRILSELSKMKSKSSILKHAEHILQGSLPEKLSGFLFSLKRLLDNILEELFDNAVWLLWTGSSNAAHWFRMPDESPISLVLATPNSLCLADDRRYAITLVIPSSKLPNWRDWLPIEGSPVDRRGQPITEEMMTELVQDDNKLSGIKWKLPIVNTYPEFEPFVELNIKCLDEKTLCTCIHEQRLAFFTSCKIMSTLKETGRRENELIYNYKKPYIIIDMPAIRRGDNNVGDLPMKREIRNKTRKEIKTYLLNVFSRVINSPTEIYIDTIMSEIGDIPSFIASNHLRKIRDRLGKRCLSNLDIDHLLLLTMQLVQGMGTKRLSKN